MATSTLSVYAATSPKDAPLPYQVEKFTVVSKNTITGEISSRECDTSATTLALNQGVTTMSTPAYKGSLPSTDITGINSEIAPQYIIGSDDRKRVFYPQDYHPYRTICRVVAYWDMDEDGIIDDTVTVGTGFLEGPNAVVTAGHCIYENEQKKWCEYAEVTVAQDGPNSTPFGVIRSTTINTSVAWIEDGDWNQDWAIVEIAEDIGYTVGWMGKLWTSGSLNDTPIILSGYPGDIATSLTDKYYDSIPYKGCYMWTSTGMIKNSLSARLEFDADMMGGMSGCPVYNLSNQALAINTYGIEYSDGPINGGTRITEWLYNLLEEYRPF